VRVAADEMVGALGIATRVFDRAYLIAKISYSGSLSDT
jgi:hypothetical protein